MTDHDVFVDVALQILRVVDHVRSDKPSYMRARDHHNARAGEATSSTVTRRQLADAPLAAIRALVRDAKATLVDVTDAHHMATLMQEEEFDDDFQDEGEASAKDAKWGKWQDDHTPPSSTSRDSGALNDEFADESDAPPTETVTKAAAAPTTTTTKKKKKTKRKKKPP